MMSLKPMATMGTVACPVTPVTSYKLEIVWDKVNMGHKWMCERQETDCSRIHPYALDTYHVLGYFHFPLPAPLTACLRVLSVLELMGSARQLIHPHSGASIHQCLGDLINTQIPDSFSETTSTLPPRLFFFWGGGGAFHLSTPLVFSLIIFQIN